MNQILMTQISNESKKTKKKNKTSSNFNSNLSVVKIFAILIIIFGLTLSGSGSYAFIKDVNAKKNKIVPEVSTQLNGNSIKLKVKDNAGIRSVAYAWNDSNAKVVVGRGQKEVNSVISVLTGSNRLNIIVTDTDNNKTQFVKNFENSGKDTTEPEITISNEDPKIKITVTDDTALDHVVYKYGDKDEVSVDANQDDPTKLEIYLDGVDTNLKTLHIEAIDKAQNVATKEQQVKGVTKSKISVTPDPTDPSYLVITANDEDGIRMIAFYINGQEFKTDPNTSLNTKSFSYKYKVNKGQTNITVHAYNINEQVTEFKGVYNY